MEEKGKGRGKGKGGNMDSKRKVRTSFSVFNSLMRLSASSILISVSLISFLGSKPFSLAVVQTVTRLIV